MACSSLIHAWPSYLFSYSIWGFLKLMIPEKTEPNTIARVLHLITGPDFYLVPHLSPTRLPSVRIPGFISYCLKSISWGPGMGFLFRWFTEFSREGKFGKQDGTGKKQSKAVQSAGHWIQSWSTHCTTELTLPWSKIRAVCTESVSHWLTFGEVICMRK